MATMTHIRPSWDALYDVASGQDGHFTTQQAADAGYSTQALYKHIQAGRVARIRRGVYRLTHYPGSEHEDLVVTWLWSEQCGIFSHLTALALHGLSDALPAKIHMTLPTEWDRRRLRTPEDVTLHYADIAANETSWVGAIPVTNIRRTLVDCANDHVSPEILASAAQQAVRRGLVTRRELRVVAKALADFGGIPA